MDVAELINVLLERACCYEDVVLDAKLYVCCTGYHRHSLCKGTNGPNSHKAGAVLKECSSPPPSSSLPALNDLSWQTERSNILSLGPRRLFPQGEVIDYSATSDVAWDASSASP